MIIELLKNRQESNPNSVVGEIDKYISMADQCIAADGKATYNGALFNADIAVSFKKTLEAGRSLSPRQIGSLAKMVRLVKGIK